MRWRDSQFGLCNGYHAHSSLILPGQSFCPILTPWSGVFLNKFDCGKPITTFAVSNSQSLSVATDVNVVLRPIVSPTITLGIYESNTYCLRVNHIAKTWSDRHSVPGTAEIEYLMPGTMSPFDWRICWALSNLTTSSRDWCQISSWSVLNTVFNT